jgi:uncharacterized lipoprotein YmbA
MKRFVLFLTLLLTACGTSPEPNYYGLTQIDGATAPGVYTVKIQRPGLPDFLDRPDIVSGENAYQYTIDEMHRWVEPLDRMFERILTEDLRQRLPNSKILSESDTGTADLQYVVETNITQFNVISAEALSKLIAAYADRIAAELRQTAASPAAANN